MKYLSLGVVVVTFASLLQVTPAYGQKWEKYFDKIEDKYEDGNYKKAGKIVKKTKRKIRKKLGEKSGMMAIALIKEGKNNIGLGVLTEVIGPIEEALAINKSANDGRPVEYGFNLKEAARVMVMYGNYNKAAEYLQEAQYAFEQGGVLEKVEGELDVLDAQIMIGKGFYRKAISLVESLTAPLQQKISSASGDLKEEYQKEFAELLIVKANALRKMGDYSRSDSAFIYNQRWIDENLKKTDILYAKNAMLNALLLKENGLSLEGQADLFEDAYVQAVRKYKPSHIVTMQIKENLMNSLYANRSRGKLKILTNEFEKTLKKNFPDNSIYALAEELTEIYYSYTDQDLKKLESQINGMLGNLAIPKNHQVRIDLLEFANEIGLLMGKHKNTESYQKAILSIKENLMGAGAPQYHLTKIKLANYYIDFSDEFEEVKSIYENSFKDIVDPEITDGHPLYLDILNHLAKYYEETDQYAKAARTLDRALMVARRKYDNKDIEYGKTLEKIASLQINIGSYKKADTNLKEALKILEDLKTEVADAYIAVTLITEARLMSIRGEFDEAEDNIFESDKIKEKAAITLESTGLTYKDDLAGLYIKIGRLSEAKDLLEESLQEKTRNFNKRSRHLNKTLVLKGELRLIKGDYTEAEQIARRASDITTSIFGENSTKTVPSTLLLSDVYTTIGDYQKAENLLKKAITIQKAQFGKNHIDVGKSVSRLALVKYYQDAPLSEVNELFAEAEKIIGEQLGSNNPTYADILKNMAVASMAEGQYKVAFSYLDDAGRIWSKKVSKRNNINAAEIDALKGDIYYRQKRYREAEKFYEDAQKRFDKFFSDKHPEYVKVQSKLSKTYYMQGDWRKSQDQMEQVLETYKDFIKNYFPALSEREKAKFWNTIKIDYEFYNTLIVSRNRNKKYIGELFNNALLTKALLLNSSIKIRQRIMNSTDENLKKLYGEWTQKKELLTAALSMSTPQQQDLGIDVTRLTNEVELLEKDLSTKSELFGQEVDSRTITWEDVKNSLKENEVAIEMVRFRLFDHTFTDSVMYALLYVKGDRKSEPSMVLLKNGKSMESKYLKYYRNSIKFKVEDRFSYDAFWKPIVDELGSVSTMYISPDGVYNQINLEAIPIDDEKYVIDNSNIVLVSNTKDLYLKRVKTNLVTDKQVAMMVGNPVFYLETSPGIPTPTSGLTRESAEIISDLPGTKKELNEINDYLLGKGWEINKHTEMDASEEIVKSVNNPRIFHVATHGFFQDEKLEASALDVELNQNYMYENPLLKSGLLLSGAGDILNETKFNYNVDNGILTAYEAMNLNLDQTDLVVLSACETGLGELEAGEGVYGLQRAFLVAGAKTIIMSLFKVSDDATQELMVKFYRKWIETGDKRQAFVDAKKEIRYQYGDPIYWGPFIMIGLD